ncbi:MAG: peptide chain release factor N(5)-glutamine methyltransferase [Candidatus Omnitrophica bacterium]|nr:peptide chain release factor N(5)-glutamine methyltransferase [Candidatus Omnitrophota bacterium]MBL7210407.1 peptide chain release factor N(5)-glutamine methyltransferase [Candidatus Omnitrophota bacterium]
MNETELTFCEVLGCDRLSLYLNKDYILNKDEGSRLSLALRKRALGQPLQYILGRTEFMGLTFKLTPDVLIPRPETELLVETALKIVRKFASSQVRKLKILDLGTGSGCIAVSLAKSLPEAKIYASDISAGALEVAKENAALNKVNIEFMQSDLFSNYPLSAIRYPLIISNPPYIPTEEIDKLQPEIRYEPKVALDGGSDGVFFFRRIIKESPPHLARGGLLVMEMGFNQEKSIKNIFQNSPDFEIIEVVKDYNGIERVIVAKKV